MRPVPGAIRGPAPDQAFGWVAISDFQQFLVDWFLIFRNNAA
jgi:hypothetical protein